MKKIGLITKSMAIPMILALNLFAGDLRNEDGKRYEVKVHEGTASRNTWIEGKSTTLSICSNCELEVIGIGKIKISGTERAFIKDGKLPKQ